MIIPGFVNHYNDKTWKWYTHAVIVDLKPTVLGGFNSSCPDVNPGFANLLKGLQFGVKNYLTLTLPTEAVWNRENSSIPILLKLCNNTVSNDWNLCEILLKQLIFSKCIVLLYCTRAIMVICLYIINHCIGELTTWHNRFFVPLVLSSLHYIPSFNDKFSSVQFLWWIQH